MDTSASRCCRIEGALATCRLSIMDVLKRVMSYEVHFTVQKWSVVSKYREDHCYFAYLLPESFHVRHGKVIKPADVIDLPSVIPFGYLTNAPSEKLRPSGITVKWEKLDIHILFRQACNLLQRQSKVGLECAIYSHVCGNLGQRFVIQKDFEMAAMTFMQRPHHKIAHFNRDKSAPRCGQMSTQARPGQRGVVLQASRRVGLCQPLCLTISACAAVQS